MTGITWSASQKKVLLTFKTEGSMRLFTAGGLSATMISQYNCFLTFSHRWARHPAVVIRDGRPTRGV